MEEKGIGYVNKQIIFFNRNPDPSRAYHLADHHPGFRPNYWIRLDSKRPPYCTHGIEANGLGLDTFHAPVSSPI
jgi:hypothetical protein